MITAEYDKRGKKVLFRGGRETVVTRQIDFRRSVPTLLHIAKAVNYHDRLVTQLRVMSMAVSHEEDDYPDSQLYRTVKRASLESEALLKELAK